MQTHRLVISERELDFRWNVWKLWTCEHQMRFFFSKHKKKIHVSSSRTATQQIQRTVTYYHEYAGWIFFHKYIWQVFFNMIYDLHIHIILLILSICCTIPVPNVLFQQPDMIWQKTATDEDQDFPIWTWISYFLIYQSMSHMVTISVSTSCCLQESVKSIHLSTSLNI
jgi:hypothetical protein